MGCYLLGVITVGVTITNITSTKPNETCNVFTVCVHINTVHDHIVFDTATKGGKQKRGSMEGNSVRAMFGLWPLYVQRFVSPDYEFLSQLRVRFLDSDGGLTGD